MKNISRRSFLKTGAVAAAGLTIVPGLYSVNPLAIQLLVTN